MAEFDVDVVVSFLDAAERIARRAYRLRQTFDSAANAGDGNWADVAAAAADVLTALNVLTWDSTPVYDLVMHGTGSGSPNISSNNQVEAFTRIYDTGGVAGSIQVPAWDDFVFDEDNHNLIDPTYNTAAAALALLLKNPDTGDNYVLVPQYSQSRTRKSRDVLNN